MLNPIIGIMHNQKLNRWHPILFTESPLPGPESPDKPIRHKSKGHHTEGFETRDAALKNCEELARNMKKSVVAEAKLSVDKDFEWDGVSIPAMTVFFIEKNGKIEPIF
jgi:hypothetical protein